MSANWVKRLDKTNTVTVFDKQGNALTYDRGAYQQAVTAHQTVKQTNGIKPIERK